MQTGIVLPSGRICLAGSLETDLQKECSVNGHQELSRLMYDSKKEIILSSCGLCGAIYSRRFTDKEIREYSKNHQFQPL